MSWRLSGSNWLRCLALCLAGLLAGSLHRAAYAQGSLPLARSVNVSQLTCTMTEAGAGASVTLELSYNARARERLPDELQRTVGELRRSLERPRNTIILPDFQAASWRIA